MKIPPFTTAPFLGAFLVATATPALAGTLSITAEDGSARATLDDDGTPYEFGTEVPDGTRVQVVAVANPGYDFRRFTGAVITPENPAVLSVNGDTSVTAVFEAVDEEDVVAVNVNATDRHQTIQGMGLMHTRVPQSHHEVSANRWINEFGGSLMRGIIPPDLLPETENWQDISRSNFNLNSGTQAELEYLKDVVEMDPSQRIIWTSFSPPAWMKDNNSTHGLREAYIGDPDQAGNRLSDDKYKHMAKYLLEWTLFLEEQGLPIYGLGPQNELRFHQGYDSAVYTAEEFARLVKEIGELFEAEDVERPIIFGPEDMSNANVTSRDSTGYRHRPYVDELLEPEVAPYFDVWATHGYSDGVNPDAVGAVTRYWETLEAYLAGNDKTLQREFWITEGGTGTHDWPGVITSYDGDELDSGGVALRAHEALVNANVSVFCPFLWTGADGERNTHTMAVRSGSGIEFTKKTYAAMHYYKHLRPGTVRVTANPSFANDAVSIGSFIHEENKTLVLTLINQSVDGQTLALDFTGVDVSSFTQYRTSYSEDHAEVGSVPVEDGEARIELAGECIITLVAENATFSAATGNPWAGLSAEGNGYKDSSALQEPGIGWIYDSFFPWIHTYGLGSGSGEWFYYFESASQGENNFWGYRLSTGTYFWANSAWGYHYSSDDGWVPFER